MAGLSVYVFRLYVPETHSPNQSEFGDKRFFRIFGIDLYLLQLEILECQDLTTHTREKLQWPCLCQFTFLFLTLCRRLF